MVRHRLCIAGHGGSSPPPSSSEQLASAISKHMTGSARACSQHEVLDMCVQKYPTRGQVLEPLYGWEAALDRFGLRREVASRHSDHRVICGERLIH